MALTIMMVHAQNFTSNLIPSVGEENPIQPNFKISGSKNPTSPTNLTAILNELTGEVTLDWEFSPGDFYEDFEDGIADNWVEINGNWTVSNGTYNVSSTTYQMASSYYNQDFTNFEYEVRVRQTVGWNINYGIGFCGNPTPGGSYGDWINGYQFRCQNSGDWILIRTDNYTNTVIQNWTSSPDFTPNMGSWNILKIVFADGNIDVFINDVLQGTYFDDTYLSGKVGLKMANFRFETCEYDYASLTGLSKGYTFGKLSQSEYRDVYSVSSQDENNPDLPGTIIGQELAPLPPTEELYTFTGESNKAFQHFNIYRDASVIGTTADLTYTDLLPAFGTYDYSVTALFDEGESDASNPAQVLWDGAPNISVQPTSLTDTLLSGETSVQYLTIYNDGESELLANINIAFTPEKYSESKLIPGKLAYNNPIISNEFPEKKFVPVGNLSLNSDSNNKSVLFLTNHSSSQNDFKNALSVLPNIGTFDVFNAASSTPTVDTLLPYDVVIVAPSSPFYTNSTTIGNNLATYVDLGGAVCILGNSFYGSNLSGSIMDSTYSPFGNALLSEYDAICNSFVPHPITTGLSTIETGIYNDTYPQGSGISLGIYDTGHHAAAYNPNKPIVAINVNCTNGEWGGDMMQLMSNTIDWLTGWLSVSQTSITIAAGASELIEVTFDASILGPGVYTKDIKITSNDPDEPLVIVPATLRVPYPDISVQPTSLSDTLLTDETSVQYLTINNNGDAELLAIIDVALTSKNNSESLQIPEKSAGNNSIIGNLNPEKDFIPSGILGLNSGSNSYSVLFLNTISSNNEFKTALSVLPNIETFDEVDASSSTQSVAYLLAYDVVIVASLGSFADPISMGNNLAAYVDQGGAVCLLGATFFSASGADLKGSIMDPEYSPLATAAYHITDVICYNFIPHQITSGLSSIETDFLAYTYPQGNGISLGIYDSGDHIGAYNPNKPIVTINVLPSDNHWGGDLIQMISNTIDWLTGNNQLLSVNQTSVAIAAGASEVIEVTFDATGLVGFYTADINISSNDPDEPLVIVPATLNVIPLPPPDISVTPSTISETLDIDETSTTYLTINNIGESELLAEIEIVLAKDESSEPLIIPGKSISDPDSKGNSVLYMSALSPDDNFKTALSGLPNIDTYDELDVGISTPDVAYLSAYDVVIVASGDSLADPVTLGDNLATYTDQGGAVCLLGGSFFAGGNYSLKGSIMNPAYSPIASTGFFYLSGICDIFEPHPITAGLSSIQTSCYAHNFYPQGNGITLGAYNSGYQMAAYNPDKPIVAINVYPKNGYWGGDFIQMISNTIDWFTSDNQWLSVNQLTLSIPAGSSEVIDVSFDATALETGVYLADIYISSNDPDEPLVIVPATLNVNPTAPTNLSADIDQVTGEVELKWNTNPSGGFYEDFEDGIANNFIHSDGRFSVDSGKLIMNGNNYNTFASTYYDESYGDFSMEFEITRHESLYTLSYTMGAFIRSDGVLATGGISNGYLIAFAADGVYSVWKEEEGVSTNIIPWNSSDFINTGLGVSNIVNIEAIGSDIFFFFNGNYINVFTDSTFTNGFCNVVTYDAGGGVNLVTWELC